MPEIHRELLARQRAEVLKKLAAATIPCGEVAGLHDALTSKRASEGGLVKSYAHPVAGKIDLLSPPYRFDGERLPVRHIPPTLGEGAADLLTGLLELSDERMQALKNAGVI